MDFHLKPGEEERMRGIVPGRKQENEPDIYPILTLLIVKATNGTRYPGAGHKELLTQGDLQTALDLIEKLAPVNWETVEPQQIEVIIDKDTKEARKAKSLIIGLTHHIAS